MKSVLADAAARRRITGADIEGLDETLFVEAGAGSGKTSSLVDRVVALVSSGVEVRHIAAITFTEKAAAELRDRVRRALEGRARTAVPAESARWRAAVDQVDGAAISTLHAFAQRILAERPIEAGLPPAVEVLDEVGSEVQFQQRWEQHRAALLGDPSLRRTLLLALAGGLKLNDLRVLARAFDDNWDLLSDAFRFPWPPSEPPPLDVTGLLADMDEVADALADCRDASDLLAARIAEISTFGQRLRAAPDEYEQLRLLKEDLPSCKVGNTGKSANWPHCVGVRRRVSELGEACTRACDALLSDCAHRLALAAREHVLDAAEQRRSSGRLEFHDLLVLARGLLRGPHGVEVRAAFRGRYRRLLLDEFQDTDPIQVELAVLLTSEEDDAGKRPWHEVAVPPGRLFFVGDAKQSIYRFRRADISLFLQARQAFSPQPVRLSTNFRTAPAVIDWVNHTFGQLIRYSEGAQPEYQRLDAAPHRGDPPVGPAVTLLGVHPHGDQPTADQLREREAAEVAEAVVTALAEGWSVVDHRDADGEEHWRPPRLGDITVLIPTRTSLPALERALEERDIPYRAETSSLVYTTPEVRELMAVLRAVADPTDQLSLVTALRSRVFGCGDDDLVTYRRRHRGSWSLLAPLPDDLPRDHPVGEALAYLRGLHAQLAWRTPSELAEAVVRDRRLMELGFADARPRESWRRLRFVVDHARAWGEAQGGTLREYLEWAHLQASERARTAEAVLPETDDDSVRILTVHAAKGLEFPITIVSGLSSRPGGNRAGVQVSWPPAGPVGLRVGRAAKTQAFIDFKPIDEQLDKQERLRLLYVACTRAKDHLVVSLHRSARSPNSTAQPTNADLLAGACEEAPHQQPLTPARPAAPPAAPGAIPEPLAAAVSLEEWQAEFDGALVAGSRRRTVAATAVSGLVPVEEDDPGLAKHPRDLDLPPWVKGRYGTTVGRAVHAVLQTIDLDTGAGMAEAVAAQAAAEGVAGRDSDIADLARAALASAAVRGSAGRPRWRETYVAAPVNGTVLEGYVDLLYRTPDGLVILDYKTAASTEDLHARAEAYRLQGAAYALAVGEATGERVVRCVFVFLTPDGPIEHDVTDLDAAVGEVRSLLAS